MRELDNIDMTLEQAQDHLAHIVAQRVRWGKQYDASDIGIDKITDALVRLAFAENTETAELRKELALSNRQNGATGAREAKLKKQVESLKAEIATLNAVVSRLQ